MHTTLEDRRVRSWETFLGSSFVRVHAPEQNTRDWESSWENFSRTNDTTPMWGLDSEFTVPETQGAFWSPNFNLRLVQIGSKSDAWVFRMDDPYQRHIATTFFQDTRNQFCSHTNADVHAIQMGLGVDISKQNWNTHTLARMNSQRSFRIPSPITPGKYLEKFDLKHVATCYGMPQLSQAADNLKLQLCDLGHREGWEKKGTRNAETWGWNNIPLDHEDYLIYAGLDAIAVRVILDRLCAETRAPNVLLKNDANRFNGVTARMRHRGMKLDVQKAEETHDECERKIEKLNGEIREITGGIGHTQNQALGGWLLGHGLDTTQHPTTATGKVSLAKNDLPKLANQKLDATAQAFLEPYLETKKLVNALRTTKTYLDRVDARGILHPTFHVVGASTARMAAADPNVMNVNPRLRSLFLPYNENQVLISVDFSQAELRVLAGLTQEQRMVDVYLRGGDLHQETMDNLHCDRRLAKIVNFMVAYGGGANAVSESAGCTFDEAKDLIQKFWQSYPAALAFRNHLSKLDDYVETFVGRKIPVYLTSDGVPATHKNLNYAIQSSARELLAQAVLRMVENGIDCQVWNLIHDEVVICVDRADAKDATRELEEAMRGTGYFFGVPIVTDTTVYVEEETGISRWGK